MDWLPEWAQILSAGGGAVLVGSGFYWRVQLRIKQLESDVENLSGELGSMDNSLEKIIEKSDARDSELKEQGTRLTEIKTSLDIHIPMLVNGLQTLTDKLDKLK